MLCSRRCIAGMEQPTTCHPNCFILHLLSATTEDTSVLANFFTTLLTVIMTLKSAPASFARQCHLNQYIGNNNNNIICTVCTCITDMKNTEAADMVTSRALRDTAFDNG